MSWLCNRDDFDLNQQEILNTIFEDRDESWWIRGYAGTGKTMLAVQHGIKLYQDGVVDKIIVTRPAVSVDEDLGFLPGDLNEKMAPWTRPIFDVLGEYYKQADIAEMLKEGVIEISPLAYMRGRTFKNAYIVADEMQNATVNQMKMLLTRLGEGSKIQGRGRRIKRLDQRRLAGSPAGAVTRGHPQSSR